MAKIKCGYSFWGFLTDQRVSLSGQRVDSPDGCATYAWAIIHELQKQGADVYFLQEDRNVGAYKKYGTNAFGAFEQHARLSAYELANKSWLSKEDIESLDVAIFEWRFPVITPEGEKRSSPDLLRQQTCLEILSDTNCQVFIMDNDSQLTKQDADELKASFKKPPVVLRSDLRMNRSRVSLPMQEFYYPFYTPSGERPEPSDRRNWTHKNLVYVGSRIERDRSIDRYIKDYAALQPYRTWFYGNWLKYPEQRDEAFIRWPFIQYHGRADIGQFDDVFGGAVATPLITKDDNYKIGNIGHRHIEAMYLGGVIPVAPSEYAGIEELLDESLLFTMGKYPSQQEWFKGEVGLAEVMDQLCVLEDDDYKAVFDGMWDSAMELHDPVHQIKGILSW